MVETWSIPCTNVAEVEWLAGWSLHKVAIFCSNIIQLCVACFQHGIEVSSVLPQGTKAKSSMTASALLLAFSLLANALDFQLQIWNNVIMSVNNTSK